MFRITIVKKIPKHYENSIKVNGFPSGFVGLETVFKATRISVSYYKAQKIKAHYKALGYECRCETDWNNSYPYLVNYKEQGLETKWNYCSCNYRIQAIQTFKKLLKKRAIEGACIEVYKNGSYVYIKKWGSI